MGGATEFFLWLTILNLALLSLISFLFMMLRQWILKLHADLFGISENQAATIIYALLGFYKILILFFNLVPLLVLLIIS